MKSKQGFGAMSPEDQRRIASAGGKAAHEKGVAHEFTEDEARNAGRKGGQKVSQDREHMAKIGRAGGTARGKKVKANKAEPTSGSQAALHPTV